jgi:DNA (cytosine-5)-methyltransferase 1
MVIDVFAGGGGASLGIERALGVPVDLAINHDAQPPAYAA